MIAKHPFRYYDSQMSYEQQKEIIDSLNMDIVQRYVDERPITMRLNTSQRPQLYVASFDPLAVMEYGMFRNRAPHVMGTFAVRMLITARTADDRLVAFTGAEANRSNNGYGFMMGATDLNKVVKSLNRTDVNFRDVTHY